VDVSDEFFAEAFHLLLVEASFGISRANITRSTHLSPFVARTQSEGSIRSKGGSIQWMGKSETQPNI
jgi:hypothetical protein